jgi:copper chaperone NosL
MGGRTKAVSKVCEGIQLREDHEMKKGIVLLIALSLLMGASISFAEKAPDIEKHSSCTYCGMDREQFAHSRFLIEYDDGNSFGACSIHCAAVDLATHIDKTPTSLKVGDFNTKKIIDAESATWVIGGNKPGVMTKRAKWAFENKADAEKYVQENGGEIASFDRVMQAAYEDMYQDTKMIREKRKMKRSGAAAQQQGHQHQEQKKQ